MAGECVGEKCAKGQEDREKQNETIEYKKIKYDEDRNFVGVAAAGGDAGTSAMEMV